MTLDRPNAANSPIVFLHGWGMNQEIWRGLTERLPEALRHRIRTLDLPGYGASETLNADYNLDNLVDWLAQEVTEPSYLLGWSLGGLVAQAFSTRFPDRVQALGLIASTPKFVANDSWPGIQPQVLASFSKQLATDHSALIEKFMAIQAMGSATAKQDIKQIKQWVLAAPAPDFTALSAGLDMLLNVDLRDNFANLPVTTRLILGKLDSLVPAKVIPQLQALNTKIAVHQVAKASHAPFVSHPDDFIEWLSDLVK